MKVMKLHHVDPAPSALQTLQGNKAHAETTDFTGINYPKHAQQLSLAETLKVSQKRGGPFLEDSSCLELF